MFCKSEWVESHKDLTKARQLLNALTYEAASKCVEYHTTKKVELIAKQASNTARRVELLEQFRKQYQRIGKQWVGITNDELDEWEFVEAQGKSLSRQIRAICKGETSSAAAEFIAEYKRKLGGGHVKSGGYLPDVVRELHTSDLDRRRGKLAAMAADKICRNEGVCHFGRSAIGSTWRRLVVDKLPSLVSATDQIYHILTLDAESIKSIRDSLSHAYHTGCKYPNCAYEDIIRRLGEGVRETPSEPPGGADVDDTNGGANGDSNGTADGRIQCDGCVNDAGCCPTCSLVAEILSPSVDGIEPCASDDDGTDSCGEDGGASLPGPHIEDDNANESDGDGGALRRCRVSLSSIADLSEGDSSSVGGGSGSEGASHTPEDVLTIHVENTGFSDGAEVQSGASPEDSTHQTQGVPTPVKVKNRRRKVRRDNGRNGDISVAIRRGEDPTRNTGDEPVSTLEDEQVHHKGLVRGSTPVELAVQGPSIGQTTLDTGLERVSGRPRKRAQVARRLLDSLPRRVARMQGKDDNKDTYAGHMGCADTFRLLPQSTQESVRKSLGYYPSRCEHGVTATPLYRKATSKIVGHMFSGKPGYSVILLSNSEAQSCLQGGSLSFRLPPREKVQAGTGVRKSGEKGRRVQGTANDTVSFGEVQRDAGKVHPPNGKASVQAEGPAWKHSDSKRHEQQTKGQTPLESMATGGRPRGIVPRLDEVGPALQHTPAASAPRVLLDDGPGLGAGKVVAGAASQQRSDVTRYKIPIKRRSDERGHDDGSGQLCLTCYHCKQSVRGAAARDAWNAVEDDRRRGRFRGSGKQTLCDNCSDENARLYAKLRARVKGGTGGRPVPHDRVLPDQTTTSPQHDRDGTKPAQSLGDRVDGGRKKRSKRVLAASLGDEGPATPRAAGTGADIPKPLPQISYAYQGQGRNRVRGTSRRTRDSAVEGRRE